MRLIFYFYILFTYYPLYGVEYIYPVASYDDKSILYMMQTSSQNVQLLQWNIVTNDIQLLLCSLFNPVEVQLLPGNKGFSFLDNGRLRLKLFHKRSPKSIDFDEPLFNLNGLQWIDEHTGYCSAQYKNNFSIFQIHDDGRVKNMISFDDKDCMYPQKIGQQLFYIRRENTEKDSFEYKIMHSIYENNSSRAIINFYDKPILFLHMISESEGFVLHYSENRDTNPSMFDFFYYHLIKQSHNTWDHKPLFSFSIPTCLCGERNNQRLFESILPLVPRMIDNKIYFSDYSPDINILELYYYDLLQSNTNKITLEKTPGHIFAPLKCGLSIYCGGTRDDRGAAPYPLFTVF